MQFGKLFEADILASLALKRKYQHDLVSSLDSDEDKFFGTDFMYYGLRYDITTNKEKDHLQKMKSLVFGHNRTNITIGIRTRNNAASFEEPVIVILFDEESAFLHRMENAIISDFVEHFDEITMLAENIYWDWMPA